MRLRIAIAVSVFVLATPHSVTAQTDPTFAALTPGPHPIGFRTLFLRDTSRRWDTLASSGALRAGRPVRVSLWYPAATAGSGSSMRYGDYFHYEGPPDFRALDDTLERTDRQGWLDDLTDETPNARALVDSLFAMPVLARRDAPAAIGRFPVLLYSGGKGSREDSNAELGEYLASYGFVVVRVPQVGPSAQDVALGSSPADILLHVQDMAFAWRAVQRLAFVDSAQLAVAGHSAGGVVALQFAMYYPAVRAAVGLDGSYGMAGEGAQRGRHRSLDRDFPTFQPARFTTSLLDLRRANGIQGAVLDSSVVATLRSSDRYVVTLPRMYHGDFTEWAPLAVTLGVPWVTQADGRTRQTALEGNQRVCRAVRDFLGFALQGDTAGVSAMLGELRAIPGAVITHKPAQHARQP